VRAFLLARITQVRGEGMIEGFAVNVLGVRRKVCLHRRRQIAIGTVWHGMAEIKIVRVSTPLAPDE